VRDGVGTALFESNVDKTGWNLGVGFEYAFVGGWTAGLEYRYTSYGSHNYAIPGGAFPAAFFPHTASADNIHTNDFRFRLNYLFGNPIGRRY
jgi:outer membrane immunogenic protein